MATIRLIRTHGLSIFQQLRLEEALLRASSGNWAFLNDGCSDTAIVLGISGKVNELVHEEAAKRKGVQLIRRFSGGGTVIVDHDTIFSSIIMNATDLRGVDCYPRPIMNWTSDFYAGVFNAYGEFNLRDQDYALGDRKFAGNAQAITKQRFLHHTSFLWDFEDKNMELLKHPAKTPEYRQGRGHLDFLCKLKSVVPSRKKLADAICGRFEDLGFQIEDANMDEATSLLEESYLKSNKLLSG